MEHKLCGCPNDIPSKKILERLPPRPNRMSEPHFKIGGKTSPGRFSRHFYNLYPNSTAKEDERSDRTYSVPNFYFPCTIDETSGTIATPPRMMKSSVGSTTRVLLSPVKEHPAVLITVLLQNQKKAILLNTLTFSRGVSFPKILFNGELGKAIFYSLKNGEIELVP